MGADPALVHDAPADPSTSENVVLDDMMIALSGLSEPPSWQDDIRSYLAGLDLVKAGA
jgi:dTDP-4-dehydrorhamnose reductase